nr:retroviral-like aspartic protease family protein [uncultured Rhodopila sp.]
MSGKILLLLCALLLPATADAACSVTARATIPLDVVNGAIIVPVEVNGIAASFILDTGAQRSVVTGEAVRRLGLARDQWVGTTLSGVGGIDRRANADPRSFSMGGVKLVRRTLNHDTSLTVGIIPRAVAGDRVIDGLLGRDYLSVFDLDLDIPAHRLSIYTVQDCAGRFLPWSGAYTSISVSFPAQQGIIVAVSLDGTPLRALLDSGSGATLLTAPGMVRMRLQDSNLTADPVDSISGLGPHTVPMHLHRFRTLDAGGEALDKPAIWVAPVRLPLFVHMLLGQDWLASRRVWISYATKQVFVAAR